MPAARLEPSSLTFGATSIDTGGGGVANSLVSSSVGAAVRQLLRNAPLRAALVSEIQHEVLRCLGTSPLTATARL